MSETVEPVETSIDAVRGEIDEIINPDMGLVDPVVEAEKWKALARKHEAAAKVNAEAAIRLKELEDLEKTEVERLAEKAALLEAELTSERVANLRTRIAAESGLPANLASRLTGSDEEAMRADAKALLEAIAAERKPASFDAGPRGSAPAPSTDDWLRNKLLTR